VINVAANDYI